LALLALVVTDAAHELLGLGGSGHSSLIDTDFADAVIGTTGLFILARGLSSPREWAWILFGVANLAWFAGDVLWAAEYSGRAHQPATSVADVFWLAWYPLGLAGMAALVRSRLRNFDLPRWIDGIALALLVATPGVALALQPAIEASHRTLLDHIVTIAYPALDILLLGAAVGVLALGGWRPGRVWYLLAIGLAGWVVVDAVYSVQSVKGNYEADVYDWLWPAGALLLAYAAWQPRKVVRVHRITGWAAVILPLCCQLVAVGIQIWGLVADLGISERIMGIAVLVLVIVQLFAGRPRGAPETATEGAVIRGSPPDVQIGDAPPELERTAGQVRRG
jgi:hypothetical protein